MAPPVVPPVVPAVGLTHVIRTMSQTGAAAGQLAALFVVSGQRQQFDGPYWTSHPSA
jgi:hypothetical protein